MQLSFRPVLTLSATAMDITPPEHRKVHVTYGKHPGGQGTHGLHQLAELRPFTQQERPYPFNSLAPHAFSLTHSTIYTA